MLKQLYNKQDLPMDDLEKIGLAKNGTLYLDDDDLKAMLSGRRTSMLRLENLTAEGLHIPLLDAKLSLTPNTGGSPELLVHPIYRKAQQPSYLTADEAEKLEKGELGNVQKMTFDDAGDLKELLVEFDKETNEFIVTDSEKVIVPDSINDERLTPDQKEKFRKGKKVELGDGTQFQYSGKEPKGINSNKLKLIASLLIDGGITYLLYTGLNALFGEKHDEKEAKLMSKGYRQALADMQSQQKQTAEINKNLQGGIEKDGNAEIER